MIIHKITQLTKIMRKIFFLTGLLILNCYFLEAQTTERLPWVNGVLPKAQKGSEYRVALGDAPTLDEARNIALNSFLAQISSQAGVTVNSETVLNVKSKEETVDGSTVWQETSDYQRNTVVKGKNITIAYIKVGEYFERKDGRYHLWELYEINTAFTNFKPNIPEYTDRYGLNAAWKSAIVPGWGQLHKGKTVKGIIFLTAEVATISSAIYFNSKRADNIRKSKETTNIKFIKEYRSRADDWALRRNVAIGAAAGIYVCNILDAALTKGKVRYAWIPKNLHFNSEQFNDYYCYGISLKF